MYIPTVVASCLIAKNQSHHWNYLSFLWCILSPLARQFHRHTLQSWSRKNLERVPHRCPSAQFHQYRRYNTFSKLSCLLQFIYQYLATQMSPPCKVNISVASINFILLFHPRFLEIRTLSRLWGPYSQSYRSYYQCLPLISARRTWCRLFAPSCLCSR